MTMHSNNPGPTTPGRRVTEASPGSVAMAPPDPRRRAGGDPPSTTSSDQRVTYAGSGITGGLVLLMLLGFAAIMLVAQNTDDVRFDFLWWSATLPLAVLLLAAAFLVIALDQIVGAIWRSKRRRMLQLTSER